MPIYGYVILAAGTLAWLFPFLVLRRNGRAAAQIDRRARWGLLLIVIAYSLLWQGRFWTNHPAIWQIMLSVIMLILAAILSWSSALALGRQWRIDAGLNADHKLVRSGPYGLIRHPIYTSMFCLLLGTGLLITPIGLFVASAVLFALGTAIRVRAEDSLLESRFGDEFRDYRNTVPAYLPWKRLN